MAESKIIIAESSDIMLNGIEELFLNHPAFIVVGKAMRYTQLCHLVKQAKHDLVVLGPMITEKFSHQLMGYLVNQFPDIKIVQINLEDDKEIILKKIEKAALSIAVK